MQILPFDFRRLEDNKVLLTNIAGEFSVLDDISFIKLCRENFDSLSENIINELLAKNFIAHKENLELTESLLANKLRSKKDFLSYFTSLHMIVVTLNCNCACTYCHASSKAYSCASERFNMNVEVAEKVVDKIFESPSPVVKIEFQGGEPLLNWDIIKFIIEYSTEKNLQIGKELSFVICTNLLEINKEQLEFMKKYDVYISTSCDGFKSLHDKHRKSLISKSAFDSFHENLKLCRQELGENKISALLTVTKDNLYSLDDVVNCYISLNFKNIFIRALNPYGYANINKMVLSYDIDEFINEYKKILRYIINVNLNGVFFVESYAALLLKRILTPFSTGFVDLQSPSGAGISGAIYYYNGDVYPADEGRMLAEQGDKTFCLGNVLKNNYNEIFNGDLIHKIVKNSCVESLPECHNCVFKSFCGADPIRYYVESGNIIGKRYESEFCKKNKEIISEIFNYLIDGKREIMEIFWSWITMTPLRRKNE